MEYRRHYLKLKEKIINPLKERKEIVLIILFFFAIYYYLSIYFKPEFMLTKTISTGGDMSSHYYTAQYVRDYFIPNFRLTGWTFGNYLGTPLLVFYFPLPFFIMGLLSYIIPLEYVFKIVSASGLLLLPVATYFMFRLMKFRNSTALIGAGGILTFIFNESYTMWGGNILSTMAGEFTYSIGIAVSVLFLGTIYSGVTEKKWLILNSILLALVGLCHVYTLLFAGLTSTTLILLNREEYKERIKYLSKVYIISFLLIGWWIIPLLFKTVFTTPYVDTWHIGSIKEYFPTILLPFFICALVSLVLLYKKTVREDGRNWFFMFGIIVAMILYYITPILKVVDIRFLPFMMISSCFLGIYAIDHILFYIKAKYLFALIVILLIFFSINLTSVKSVQWLKWNYDGFEAKSPWPKFEKINNFLKGDYNDSRVVFEHSDKHNQFGSIRAFENLPLFTGRGTMEGVYMQSCPNSPEIFYVQSEVSKIRSCPFPTFTCTKMNMAEGIKDMEDFNVGNFIVVSDEAKKALKELNYTPVFSESEYDVYQLNPKGYVTVPKYWPIYSDLHNAQLMNYYWYITNFEVPVVYNSRIASSDKVLIKEKLMEFKDVQNPNYDYSNYEKIDKDCHVSTEISYNKIKFKTDCVGYPHIIKVSYFPNWKVKGASKVYPVSPAFMLVYPTQNNVELYYGHSGTDLIGYLATLIGIAIIFIFYNKREWFSYFDNYVDKILNNKKVLIGIGIVLLLLVAYASYPKAHDFEQDRINYFIGVSLKNYVQCKKAGTMADQCFIEVGKQTNDYNLCAVEVTGPKKDICFYEIAVFRNDMNMCKTRIKDETLKQQCIAKLNEKGIK